MPVTIRDVAEKSGVPISDAARVLSEYTSVEGETRRKVIEAAREIGFPLDQPVGAPRTLNLGVLFSEESKSGLLHPFFATLLNAFKTEAEARGYDITFINHNIGTEAATYLEHSRYRRVDGVVLACGDFYSEEVQELLKSEIPCVAVDYTVPNQDSVLSDNRAGIRQLVDYAVSMGHRRIAFIHGQRNSQVTEERIDEFRKAMAAQRLPVLPGYLVESRYGELDVLRPQVEKMLHLPQRPTCILLPDDTAYLGAQEVIREEELRIPADISLAGYDGIPLTQALRPHLTTVSQDAETMGREAARMLIGRIEKNEPAGRTVTVPVQMLKGETISWCNEW